ncbi:MAG: hypothetical protein AABX12_05190 [Nanoarchaeota archaeon]
MVKVVDITEEERRKSEGFAQLERITSESFPEDITIRVDRDLGLIFGEQPNAEKQGAPKKLFIVYGQTKNIYVFNPEYETPVRSLAEEYERAGQGEFTVRTDYSGMGLGKKR